MAETDGSDPVTTPVPTLPGLLRHWLGISSLEALMAKVSDVLTQLAAQQTEASAAQQAAFGNLNAAIDRLEQAVRDGEVSPEIQAAADQITEGFRAMTEAADAADDRTQPAPDGEETPAPGDEDTPTA